MSAQAAPTFPPGTPGAALPSPQRLRSLLQTLGAGLLEREAAVRLALLAALAGEHLLLIGPPGTAKSALARRLHRALADAPYFERLLTRFSTPEELFGPLSLKALEDDRYERLTTGYLPSAGLAFLDEVFKANSAILNALLTLLNERCFDNGVQRLPVPLVAVVGASNEIPSDEALQAFYDRFLLRVPVQPVSDAHFAQLLALGAEPAPAAPPNIAPLQARERQALAAAAQGVALGPDFLAACQRLRAWLAPRQWPASDRRWRQFVGLARTQAASEGRPQLDGLDLWLVPYVFSPGPEQLPELQAWFVTEGVLAPAPTAPWLERAVQAFEQQLALEERAQAEPTGLPGDDAGKLALARQIGLRDAHTDAHADIDIDADASQPAQALNMPRLLSARLQARQRRHYSPLHIAARRAQLDEIIAPLQARQAENAAARAALAAALAPRLWLPDALASQLLARYDGKQALLDALLARLATVQAGFAALPCDPGLPDAAPPGVQWPEASPPAAA